MTEIGKLKDRIAYLEQLLDIKDIRIRNLEGQLSAKRLDSVEPTRIIDPIWVGDDIKTQPYRPDNPYTIDF